MKKILFYVILAISFVLVLPYIIIAILIEYYYKFILWLIDKPTSYIQGCGTYPKWMSAIFSYVEDLQYNDYIE